jgi:hypothetical protein
MLLWGTISSVGAVGVTLNFAATIRFPYSEAGINEGDPVYGVVAYDTASLTPVFSECTSTGQRWNWTLSIPFPGHDSCPADSWFSVTYWPTVNTDQHGMVLIIGPHKLVSAVGFEITIVNQPTGAVGPTGGQAYDTITIITGVGLPQSGHTFLQIAVDNAVLTSTQLPRQWRGECGLWTHDRQPSGWGSG